ncbi:hypothetical protein MIND_01309200 [Mycena indigotica]|uniref:Uncharacterized protein n=1 Tax=Mycena indigotica TaxID=2126181 RepID=A0A8H6S0J4_9AGAR|nr:uncharacterized protein MIND_01309200 [Mycena indigotica]KAF7290689.1 hypothetical protein MIND_01309200 [Mycena indigotica]
MSDLTVLVSPIPQLAYSSPPSPLAARRKRSPSPIMVTLESDAPETSETVARTAGPASDPALLSPPINTWKSRPQSRNEVRPRPRHAPTRSQSAPPSQTAFVRAPMAERPFESNLDQPMSAGVAEQFGRNPPRPPRRNHTMFGAGYMHVSEGMTMRGGELVRPPPPLLRPTTFWRRAHRSGVAAASYSPASHLIRRSTFIAAGLQFDAPVHDLSALGVESRITGEEGITRPSPRVVEIPQAFELLNI